MKRTNFFPQQTLLLNSEFSKICFSYAGLRLAFLRSSLDLDHPDSGLRRHTPPAKRGIISLDNKCY